MEEMKSFTVRIPEKMLEEFHYICKYHGRSANAQIRILIREDIAAYREQVEDFKLPKEE